MSPSSGVAPLSVSTDASASTDTDSTPISTYSFNLGDGTAVGPQPGATASHTYTNAGTYTVTVTVTDTAGHSSTATATVNVTAAVTGATYPLRGVYDRMLADEANAGFNLIDSTPSTVGYLPSGLRGLVWVGDYDNLTCTFEESDSQLQSDVTTHMGDSKVGVWFIADEPDPFSCPTAYAQVKNRTALIHSIDSSAKVLVVLDSNSAQQSLAQMAGWVGTADIFGLDPYTCWQGQSSCQYEWIDQVAAEADAVGLPYWGVVQAFGDTSSGDWFAALDSNGNEIWGQARLPTVDELHEEFVHWRATHMQDYLVFAWEWPKDDSALWLANQPDLISQLTTENQISAGAQ